MNTATCTTAVGVFASRQNADAAIDDLYEAGFTSSEIGVVTRDSEGRAVKTSKDDAEDAGEGGLVGAIAGAGIGGLIGLGVISNAIPVIGPALFGGTLAGILASNAAGGAAVAGIIGALVGWGVPEEDAKYYQGEIAAGRTIVTVTGADRCDEARAILRRHGATSRDPAFVQSTM